MPYLRQYNVKDIHLSKRERQDGKRKFTDIRVHPDDKNLSKGLKGQLGDDEMTEPLVPLKAPESFENQDPDRPAVFLRLGDTGTCEWLQSLDEKVKEEVSKMDLGAQYHDALYRNLYIAPREEGQTGACSVKLALVDIPEKKVRATTFTVIEKDEDGEDRIREGSVADMQPGSVEALYMSISINRVWRVNGPWGLTMYANEVVIRKSDDEEPMVIGGKVLGRDKKLRATNEGKKKRKHDDQPSSPIRPSSPEPETEPTDDGVEDGDEGVAGGSDEEESGSVPTPPPSKKKKEKKRKHRTSRRSRNEEDEEEEDSD